MGCYTLVSILFIKELLEVCVWGWWRQYRVFVYGGGFKEENC